MTAEDASKLKPGTEVFCQAPGRVFHLHRVTVVSVDSYDNGQIFVMARLPNPPPSIGPDPYVFEPPEIEVLQ